MSRPLVLIDGRVLDDRYVGVRRFWVPVLCAWAERGGYGMVAHCRGQPPEPALIAAGFDALELRHRPFDPLGFHRTRRIVQRTAAKAALSPFYLTLDGAPRNIATVFDLTGRRYPRSLRSRLLWEAAMQRTRRASRVICATHAVADRLKEAFPQLQHRIAVVSAIAPSLSCAAGAAGHTPNEGFVGRGTVELAQPYALAIASHRPHKRLDALVAAWRSSGTRVSLVIAGRDTEALHAPPLIHGLGFLSDAELELWLRGTACLISASLAEGFGLPILAALAAGVPVVAAADPALQEIAGEAVVWAASDDVDGLVQAALAAISDVSQSKLRVQHGQRRAAEFSATRAAQELARALE